ncbi:UNVERIFIED_CONTAM: hypothetical protein Slati_2998900 [Sesamum latifolium]|uniref:Uncharacterized protein n=1 Tax=Sesamum latifolium TaxID=2727402 RepID=A0AAW2VG55_9LAMI
MEVYIDDMLVKNHYKESHIQDLQECFEVIRHLGMKFNPSKCTFGVRRGKFLGYLISHRGIEVNPEKINAIQDMSPPTTKKEVQKLTGRMAALSRFLSRGAERGLPFFKILRKVEGFSWNKECQEAFGNLKEYLSKPPLLTKPQARERLYIYLSASEEAVSAVLVRTEEKEHQPVYYVSKVLQGAKQDFISETTGEEDSKHNQEWTMFVDGSSTSSKSGVGIVIKSLEAAYMEYTIILEFPASNNEAEYEAILLGCRLIHAAGARKVHAYSDSQLVLNQAEGEYKPRQEKMTKYLAKLREEIEKFEEFKLEQIPRKQNLMADQLKKLASSNQFDRGRRITLLSAAKPARVFSSPLLKCLSPNRAEYVLREVHEGSCGNHSEARSVARKVLKQGYYWLTMLKDAFALVQKCSPSQKHANHHHNPSTFMKTMESPCPFDMWGMDIVGKLPCATRQREYLIVAVDYFTKWVEAEPLAKIGEKEVMKFIWQNIICQFGIPRVLIADNGTQFQGGK